MRSNDVDVTISVAFAKRRFHKMDVRLHAIVHLHVRDLLHRLVRTLVHFEELNHLIC